MPWTAHPVGTLSGSFPSTSWIDEMTQSSMRVWPAVILCPLAQIFTTSKLLLKFCLSCDWLSFQILRTYLKWVIQARYDCWAWDCSIKEEFYSKSKISKTCSWCIISEQILVFPFYKFLKIFNKWVAKMNCLKILYNTAFAAELPCLVSHSTWSLFNTLI